MRISALVDIFQSKVDELISNIEGVKKYIDDKITLIKYWFTKHNKKLRIIFGRLRASDLKINAPKCSFGINEIHYLGYVIIR